MRRDQPFPKLMQRRRSRRDLDRSDELVELGDIEPAPKLVRQARAVRRHDGGEVVLFDGHRKRAAHDRILRSGTVGEAAAGVAACIAPSAAAIVGRVESAIRRRPRIAAIVASGAAARCAHLREVRLLVRRRRIGVVAVGTLLRRFRGRRRGGFILRQNASGLRRQRQGSEQRNGRGHR